MGDKNTKRVLLKLSGEVLGWENPLDKKKPMSQFIAGEIAKAVADGFQIAIVIGGGNIMRGSIKADEMKIDRVVADQIGMLGTVINAMYLKEAMKTVKLDAVVMCAFDVGKIVKRFNRDKAVRYLEKGKVVIFSGGTGNPYFSTDTASALRALEIGALMIVKGSKVDGIYDKDPMKFTDAKKLKRVTYDEAIEKSLGIMDLTAFTLLKGSSIKISVYNMTKPGALLKTLKSDKDSSVVVP